MKLLVVINEKYQDIEVNGFLGTLKRCGKIDQIIYWNSQGLKEVKGSNEIGSIRTINDEIKVDDFDAIFIPGGAACVAMRNDQKALDLIAKFRDANKWIFAICDAPNVIYEKAIITDKKYASYPIENINQTASKLRVNDYVCVDGKYITGKGPSASIDLAIKVLEICFSKELSEIVYKAVYAIE